MSRKWMSRAVALLLCVLMVPGTAGAVSWGDFVAKVNAATTDTTFTEEDFGGETTVDGPINSDALLIQSGVTVTIQGLTFTGGMVIAGGNIVLEDATIENAAGNGITIVGDANGTHLELTLDTGCVIDASESGIFAHYGLDAGGEITVNNGADIAAGAAGISLYRTGGGDEDIIINVNNSGDIHAGTGAGISVTGGNGGLSGDAGDVIINIVNSGDIDGAVGQGIMVSALANGGAAYGKIVNLGDISDVTLNANGFGQGVYAQTFSMDGSATAIVDNDGTVSNTAGPGLGANAQARGEGDATAIIINRDQGVVDGSTLGLSAEATTDIPKGSNAAFNGDANVTVVNSGTITNTSRSGVSATANSRDGGDANIAINNSGAVENAGRYGVYAYGNGDDVSIAIQNNGQAGGALSGAFIEGPTDMNLQVSGQGTFLPGSYTGPATGDAYTGENGASVVLFVDYPNAESMPTGDALREEIQGIAERSGLLDLQDGNLVMVAYNRTGGNDAAVDDFQLTMTAPPPAAEPEAGTEQPITVLASAYQAPAKKGRPAYKGISYSEEWLYQAFLADASRDLRVYELATDENGLPEKGEHLVFKETLHGNIQLSLSNYAEKQLLTVVSMQTLAKLIRMGIHTLNVSGENSADSYPVEEIYNALVAAGHGDAQYVYLAGTNGDAVIIDRNGDKIAL